MKDCVQRKVQCIMIIAQRGCESCFMFQEGGESCVTCMFEERQESCFTCLRNNDSCFTFLQRQRIKRIVSGR